MQARFLGKFILLVAIVAASIRTARAIRNSKTHDVSKIFGSRSIHDVSRRVIRSASSGVLSNSSESTASTNTETTGEPVDPYLVIDEEMQNQTLFSEDKASFKCKVDGYPKDNMQYTWYKDNEKLVESLDKPGLKIKDRSWGSRLQIDDVFSSDSGWYRCEASNGYRRVHTRAYLSVSFNLLPAGTGTHVETGHLQGKCEIYAGYVCGEFLEGKYVYLEAFQEQTKMEHDITGALTVIGKPEISSRCQSYARAAFCYSVFAPCATNADGSPSSKPKAVRLCQEDCDLLKHDICRNLFFQQTSNELISQIINEADCTDLPPTTSANKQCTGIGLPSVVNQNHKCYNGSGQSYRGTLSVTSTGETCQVWPRQMLFEYPELSGGHNFCRNPSGDADMPWCYVDKKGSKKVDCQVPQCNFNQGTSPDLIMILIPAVSVPLLLGCFVLVFCFACKKRKEKGAQHTKGIRMETKSLSAKKAKVPELSSNVVHVIGELGDGKFGKVFKAQILSNLHYCPNDPVAVKTLIERASPAQVQDFQREMETFSNLQHPNVASLKAVVVQPSLRCMIFEFTNGVDLHEYLVLHSPQADFAKPPSSASSHASTIIDHSDFMRMAIQITAGMEYLTSNNFIHRDLSARNVLVCGNMDLKICNLGVVRDSYLSSYYRSPQGGQMLPIRWMAPESLQCWKFSDKSTVWSFGVLLWEMFSYGLQPYCGYSNHEVLEMISRRQILTCPDQCPAKMYSLMHECWAAQPAMRPLFKDIHAKLVGWEGTSTTRMTSQLAQGIHRQLTNVIRDGSSGQYPQQYGPQHGTMIDGMNKPPPGVQNYYSASPTSGFLTASPPGAPHTSPASKLYNSPGGATSASSGHSGNVYPNQYHPGQGNHHLVPSAQPTHVNLPYQPPQKCPSYSSTHSRSSGSVASSEYNHHAPLHVSNLASHPEVQEIDTYPPPPPQVYLQQPQHGRRPMLSNNHQDGIHGNESHIPPQQPRFYVNVGNNPNNPEPGEDSQLLSRVSRPNSGTRPEGRIPLSLYQEQNNAQQYEDNRSPTRPKPILAPKPPVYFNPPTNPNPDPRNDPRHKRNGSATGNNLTADRMSGMSSPLLGKDEEEGKRATPADAVSGKATSCDSGLPCDDLDSEGADSHRPLIGAAHSPSRASNKNVLVAQSASSSVSGSTQATNDTRIST